MRCMGISFLVLELRRTAPKEGSRNHMTAEDRAGTRSTAELDMARGLIPPRIGDFGDAGLGPRHGVLLEV
jgi:hypothetical protein